jgi:hypothetical protein
MMSPESPSEIPSVLMKSLAQRFMNCSSGQGVTAFVGQFPLEFVLERDGG